MGGGADSTRRAAGGVHAARGGWTGADPYPGEAPRRAPALRIGRCGRREACAGSQGGCRRADDHRSRSAAPPMWDIRHRTPDRSSTAGAGRRLRYGDMDCTRGMFTCDPAGCRMEKEYTMVLDIRKITPDVIRLAPKSWRDAMVRPDLPAVTTAAVQRQAVERSILRMRDQLDVPLTLDEMAEIAHLSRFHFNRVFAAITGISPRKFLATLRLEYAKRLLLTSEMSITEVCFETGYSSLGTFVTISRRWSASRRRRGESFRRRWRYRWRPWRRFWRRRGRCRASRPGSRSPAMSPPPVISRGWCSSGSSSRISHSRTPAPAIS